MKEYQNLNEYIKDLEDLLADIYRYTQEGDNGDITDEQMQFWEEVVDGK